jgi:ABC-2 type transport system permease protein
MTHPLYLRYEILRTFRNRRFLLFSLGFPLVLFLVVAGSNRHAILDGISFPLYYMTGMTAWGAMVAVVSSGARIAAERQTGWTRQMRITPLRTRSYFGSKVVSGYLMAALSLAVLYAVGSFMGVRLSAGQWLTMTGLLLAGLVPFTVLGILLGHLLTADSVGPALGGVTAVLALLGGAWGPLATRGVLLDVVKCIPSYWLVQAGKTALGGHGWPAEGWLVAAAWTVVLAVVAVWVYRRDTARV